MESVHCEPAVWCPEFLLTSLQFNFFLQKKNKPLGIIIPGIEYGVIKSSFTKYQRYAAGFCNVRVLSITYAIQYCKNCKFNE